MVAGLLNLVNGGFPPVGLLYNCLKRSQAFDDAGAYGLDLLRAKILFEGVLKDILRCNVEPVFVFVGIPDKSPLGLKSAASRCFKMRKHYRKAYLDVAPTKYRSIGIFFPCVRQFVVNCLRDLGLHCAQSAYDSMSVHLGISFYLDCPIASMSSPYYLLSHPSIPPEEIRPLVVNEVKLVDLNTDFYRVDEEGGKEVFKLKVFHPELSVLRRVPATSRPLIALLMNSDLLPILPAPIKIEPSGSESYTSAKLRAVIDWVAETNPIHVLQAIMESTTDSKYTDYLSENILKYLGDFCPNFVEASQVLKMLDLGDGIPLVKAQTAGIEGEKDQQRHKSSSTCFVHSAAEILNGATVLKDAFDFLSGWPMTLVHLYRSNLLDRLFIVAIYSKFGVALSHTSDYLIELPCTYGPSRILRYAHYCLMRGVEEANGLTSKLVGLRPCAREICYEGDFRFKTYMIEVKSMQLPRNCSADDFLYAFIGLDCMLDVPDWSVALVLSCVLWHQQKAEHFNCGIAECPLILSVLVVAVATHFNVECGVSAVADHYDGLKSLIVSKMEASGTYPSPAVEKTLIHSVLELMLVYDHYLSLCRLLAALQDGSGMPDFSSAAYNRFPPHCVVFPSLALLVHMAAHLRCEETPSGVAMRLWLVNAFLRAANDASDVVRLNDAVTVLSTLRKFVSTVKLNFTAPKVEVTDPPAYFLPKDERSPPKSCTHPASTAFPSKSRGGGGGGGIAGWTRNSSRMQSSQPSGMHEASVKKGESYASRLSERVERMTLDS
ncbi:hypothetical protein TSMEX_007297 [Taenia solium]|eukprot:TsM_000336000 transcript=TsM_000336000 gene=TsM_000336000